MNLKEEVCSLEYAKHLKKLGIRQDAPFTYVELPYKYDIDIDFKKTITETETKLVFGAYATIDEKIDSWSAFTIGQLFELLPSYIDTKKDEPFNIFWFHLAKSSLNDLSCIVNYYCTANKLEQDGDPFFATSLIQCIIYDKKLADSLAKLLIYLLESELIKI